ncbi:unnamed protein product [Mytilus coruscus]|uniref:Uncharacterized protein n=1 Tax=Mytilus coruscus TaxID=42192 RepID=A0A6J8DKP2_MYTCO|nr:unnamed protein product [Mytilus coruscus]
MIPVFINHHYIDSVISQKRASNDVILYDDETEARDGKELEEHRKPTQEKMLRPAVVANYVPLIEKVSNDFIEKLERKEKTEDLFTDLLNYTTESVGMLCFNKRLCCLDSDNNPVPVAVHVRKLFEMLGTAFMRPRKSHLSTDSKFFKEYEKHTFEFGNFVLNQSQLYPTSLSVSPRMSMIIPYKSQLNPTNSQLCPTPVPAFPRKSDDHVFAGKSSL